MLSGIVFYVHFFYDIKPLFFFILQRKRHRKSASFAQCTVNGNTSVHHFNDTFYER